MGHLSSRASSLTQKNIWQASLYAVWSHSRHGPRRNTLRFGLIVEFIVLHLCARPFVLKFPALERRTVSVFSEIAARNSIVGEFRSRRNGGGKWSFSLGIRTGYFTNALISTFISGNGRLKFGSDFFGERLRRKKRTFRFFFRSELKKKEGGRQQAGFTVEFSIVGFSFFFLFSFARLLRFSNWPRFLVRSFPTIFFQPLFYSSRRIVRYVM